MSGLEVGDYAEFIESYEGAVPHDYGRVVSISGDCAEVHVKRTGDYLFPFQYRLRKINPPPNVLRAAAGMPPASRGDALANGDRMQEYGSPIPSFTQIGRLWSAYLSAPEVDPDNLTADDVASMMVLLKVSRRITDKKADTLDDIEGYVSCARMIDEEKA